MLAVAISLTLLACRGISMNRKCLFFVWAEKITEMKLNSFVRRAKLEKAKVENVIKMKVAQLDAREIKKTSCHVSQSLNLFSFRFMTPIFEKKSSVHPPWRSSNVNIEKLGKNSSCLLCCCARANGWKSELNSLCGFMLITFDNAHCEILTSCCVLLEVSRKVMWNVVE